MPTLRAKVYNSAYFDPQGKPSTGNPKTWEAWPERLPKLPPGSRAPLSTQPDLAALRRVGVRSRAFRQGPCRYTAYTYAHVTILGPKDVLYVSIDLLGLAVVVFQVAGSLVTRRCR